MSVINSGPKKKDYSDHSSYSYSGIAPPFPLSTPKKKKKKKRPKLSMNTSKVSPGKRQAPKLAMLMLLLSWNKTNKEVGYICIKERILYLGHTLTYSVHVKVLLLLLFYLIKGQLRITSA